MRSTDEITRDCATVCVSGYFDPLHRGLIDYINDASLLADKLIVILNTDAQRHTAPRMSIEDRKYILESLRAVDQVVLSIDKDASVTNTLRWLAPDVFAKGQTASPSELAMCNKLGIKVVCGVGSAVDLVKLGNTHE